MYVIVYCTASLQEKVDALTVLGADVRQVPAVPFDNPKNYNHQVCLAVAFVEVRLICLELGDSRL